MAVFIIPAFVAGLITFFAPCTFPLLPVYIGFISGSSVQELTPPVGLKLRRKIFLNGLFYVIGFSIVFILLGSLFGLGGAVLIRYRELLIKIGAVIIIIFGLFMVGLLNWPWLSAERRLPLMKILKPGRPASACLFGATFALGWTPCVGPVLGSILTLAAASATVWSGIFLLLVFSLGLAVPFLLVAAAGGWAFSSIQKANRYLRVISLIGGILLILLGVLLLTEQFPLWVGYFSRFTVIPYHQLLRFL